MRPNNAPDMGFMNEVTVHSGDLVPRPKPKTHCDDVCAVADDRLTRRRDVRDDRRVACTVGSLINGKAYTFTVTATNAIGTSFESDDSARVTPDDMTTVEEEVADTSTTSGASANSTNREASRCRRPVETRPRP